MCAWKSCIWCCYSHQPPIYWDPYILILSNKSNEWQKKNNMGWALKSENGRCTETWPSLEFIYRKGEGDFGLMVRVKRTGGILSCGKQRGCSNNDVVLELWTEMLAGLLKKVYPSAAGQLHNMTHIKLSLPKCNNGISLKKRRGQTKIEKRKREREFAVLFIRRKPTRNEDLHCFNLTKSHK